MMKQVQSLLNISLGAFLIALNIHFFLSPNKVGTGGTSGAGIVISQFMDLPVGVIMFTLDMLLFVLGLLLIGPSFGLKSVFASLSLSGMVWGLEMFHPLRNPIGHDVLIQIVIGTLIGAIGVAMIFNQGASAGGTGVLAKIIHKFTGLELGRAVLASDVLIVLASAWFFGLQVGLYAFFGLLLKGMMIDRTLQFFNENKEVVIISEHSEEIKEYIVGDLERGATVHSAKGAFSDDQKEVITTIVGRKDFSKLKSYIQSTDEKAFITVHSMNEIWGNNFKSFA
ncbi:YitT family protein [Rossellomorea vietnamensis]|uniref:YitT family protein n=1 Tax=Rossellomorea vietnamensis TaxID=218284 RepID=A0ACD4C1V2_9BACI|nr:YitT family protein [Rossellomorea vietnamensis]UXH42555.1 YitT family protein [Rossellomorea vietnamensis]WQI94017.1 YitT family protein [Rossellomorea vietnamensis]